MVMPACVDGDGWILLVMPLDIQLLLLIQLSGIDRGRDTAGSIAQHGQRIHIDIVVDQHDRPLGLLDQADDVGVCVENLSIVEDALDWRQG